MFGTIQLDKMIQQSYKPVQTALIWSRNTLDRMFNQNNEFVSPLSNLIINRDLFQIQNQPFILLADWIFTSRSPRQVHRVPQDHILSLQTHWTIFELFEKSWNSLCYTTQHGTHRMHNKQQVCYLHYTYIFLSYPSAGTGARAKELII